MVDWVRTMNDSLICGNLYFNIYDLKSGLRILEYLNERLFYLVFVRVCIIVYTFNIVYKGYCRSFF